jgi:RecJ-like exonuclease
MTELLQPQTLGATIDHYRALYDERAELNAQAKELTRLMEELAPTLLQQLDDLGIDSAKGKCASIRIEEKTLPVVEDWDQFYQYIAETDSWYLLERRPTSKAYQEIVAAGEEVPGVRSFVKRDITTRAI